MCKPKSRGGRRCPAHQPAFLALKSAIGETYGLNDTQMRYTLTRLRAQGIVHQPPTPQEYADFVGSLRAGYKDIDHVARRRMLYHLSKDLEDDALPDGATFYAMKRLDKVAQGVRERIDAAVSDYAATRGVPAKVAQAKFNACLKMSVTPAEHSHRTVLDPRTSAALALLEENDPPLFEESPRITMQPMGSHTVTSAGYDPEDGRLEVEVRGKIYAYRGVTEQEWERFQKAPVATLNSIRANSAQAYPSPEEAQRDAYRIWCKDCTRFRLASGHVCQRGERRAYRSMKRRVQEEATAAQSIQTPPWAVSWTERSSVDLGENPSPQQVRDVVDAYGVATFHLAFKSQDGASVVRGAFRAGRALPGEITMEMLEEGICSCSNGRWRVCEHTSKFPGASRRYYKALDERGASRNREMEFPIGAYMGIEGEHFAFTDPQISEDNAAEIGFLIRQQRNTAVSLNTERFMNPYHDPHGTPAPVLLILPKDGGSDMEMHVRAQCAICEDECDHVEDMKRRYYNAISPYLANASDRLDMLEKVERNDSWRASTFPKDRSDDSRSYLNDPDAYLEARAEAKARQERGEGAVQPITFGSVTNGAITAHPGMGRGFGLEIEYVVDADKDARAVRRAIAKALNEENLSLSDEPYEYGESSEYTGYQEWAVENDCSVNGEVISPILYDNEESWRQVARVCQIIKDHGGKVDESCGQHVHISRLDESSEATRDLVNFVQGHQDSLRRAAANPHTGKHRNTRHSRPFSAQTAYETVRTYDLGDEVDREFMVNLSSPEHTEFRDADGSLDPGHIQAQVRIAAAIVHRAETGGFRSAPARSQDVGANRRRTFALTGSHTAPERDEDTLVSDVPFRATIDALFDDEDSKRMMASLGVAAPWQVTGVE